MMSEYLVKTFYGNTIGAWLVAFAIIVGALVVALAPLLARSSAMTRPEKRWIGVIRKCRCCCFQGLWSIRLRQRPVA